VLGAGHGIQGSLQAEKFRYRAAFGTVTYRQDGQWGPRHISELMRHYRRWCQRRGEPFRCVWVAELTKRGRVHYHYVIWLRRGLTPPMPDKQGWWKHGSSNVKWARKPVSYLLKYASKGVSASDGVFPKGCRLYAVAGPTGPLGYFRCPGWMRRWARPGHVIRLKDGFWNNHTTGIGYRSPWLYHSSTDSGITLKWVGWCEFDWQFCNSPGSSPG